MSRWWRRLVVLLLLLSLLTAAVFPMVAFALATNDQITLGSSDSSHIRLFLVRATEQEGIGLEWTRKASQDGCLTTSVNYIFWEGEEADENVNFCRCLNPETRLVETVSNC